MIIALAYVDDTPDHKLDMGSEIIITEKGLLGNFGNDTIFSKDQRDVLYDLSNGVLPYNWASNIPNLPDYSKQLSNMIQSRNVGGGDTVNYNMHYDTLMTVNGNVTDRQFVENLCKKSFDYTVKTLRRYSRELR